MCVRKMIVHDKDKFSGQLLFKPKAIFHLLRLLQIKFTLIELSAVLIST